MKIVLKRDSARVPDEEIDTSGMPETLVEIHEAYAGPIFVTDQGEFLVVMRDNGIEVWWNNRCVWSSTRLIPIIPDEITVRGLKGPQAKVPTIDEMYEILARFCASHFGKRGEKARISIPANPKYDDDLMLMAFIESYTCLLSEHRRIERACDQLEVQLAGCGVIAQGYGKSDEVKSGDYGWSGSYEDVKKLRVKMEKLEELLRPLRPGED
ncbi:hypothetical protein LCGC14_0414370 [marine sediment metagenome]|uniref:Uncharacterized protein n=1 Tax=marine sediment metagenome TaxID=412755 RepID=A0A0F9TAN7_9ZZZZ